VIYRAGERSGGRHDRSFPIVLVTRRLSE